MHRSDERILTTHTGRLERPAALTKMMERHPRGRPDTPEFDRALREAVVAVAREQAAAGIDVICDAEYGKISWAAYLGGRLSGLEPAGERRHMARHSHDRTQFSEFYTWATSGSGTLYYSSPGEITQYECTGPVAYTGHGALAQDIDALLSAMEEIDVTEAFMPSTAPGSVRWANRYYETDEEYLFAIADALHEEYQAIVDAGLLLQVDDPCIATLWDELLPDVDERTYHEACEPQIEALNHALRGIPRDRVRYHVCWGSWHGPHSTDAPLEMVLPLLRRLDVGAFVVEAANARHEHETELWAELDEDRVVIPGVVSHATDTVEHPQLVAQRITRFARVVGRERVIAGTDCGLGYRVHPQIAEAKLRALADGARLASAELW
jgi:5-methyltetrahydropteroyltriglutamate--homocysteine methyltransferase